MTLFSQDAVEGFVFAKVAKTDFLMSKTEQTNKQANKQK